MIKKRKMTTLPRSGRASRSEETNNFISLIELMVLKGRSILMVLTADRLIEEMNDSKL
jgi:hypothetical protein